MIRFELSNGKHFELEMEEGVKLLHALIDWKYSKVGGPIYQWQSGWTDPNTCSIGVVLDNVVAWMPFRSFAGGKFPQAAIEMKGS